MILTFSCCFILFLVSLFFVFAFFLLSWISSLPDSSVIIWCCLSVSLFYKCIFCLVIFLNSLLKYLCCLVVILISRNFQSSRKRIWSQLNVSQVCCEYVVFKTEKNGLPNKPSLRNRQHANASISLCIRAVWSHAFDVLVWHLPILNFPNRDH